MADLDYSVGVDTTQAQRALGDLTRTVAGFGVALAGAFAVRDIATVSSRFEDLRITLQTLYRSVADGNAVFSDLKDFAKTSSFSVEELVQTVLKLKSAGLEPSIALLRLFADVSGSVADKVGALQAITDLYARTTAGGLGLEDLNRLADRGIPVFTILQEKLGLTRLEVAKIGQSAEGARVILGALEAGLAETFGGGAQAKANSLGQAFSNFKDTINNAIDTLGRFGLNTAVANFINSLGDAIQKLEPAIAAIGIGLADAFNFLAENIKIVITLAAVFTAALAVNTLIAIGRGVFFIATAFTVLAKNPLLIALQATVSVLAGVYAAFKLNSGATDDISKKYDEMAAALANVDKGGKGLVEGALNTADLKGQVAGLNNELNKAKAEIENTVVAYQRQNAELTKRLKFEQELIGSSDQQRTVKQALFDLENSYLNEVNKLLDDYRKKSASRTAEDQAQLPLIQDAIRRVSEAYAGQIEVVKSLTEENYTLGEAEKQRLSLSEFGIRSQLDGFKKLRDIQDEIAKSTMSEIEQKYYDLGRAAEESARSAIEQENSRRRSLKIQQMTAEEEQKYYQQASQSVEQLRQAQSRSYENSRLFETGWKRAFNTYVDEATNAAKRAEQLFNKSIQGIEDLLVGFVKTGKFEWKSFVASMAEELLRSNIKATLANIMSGTQGGGGVGGILGSIGSMLGFGGGAGNAKGQTANNPMYVYDIASGGQGGFGGGFGQQGQGGGGMFSGISNVFSGITNTIGSAFSGITSAVGSAFGGISDLISGGGIGGGGGGGILSSIGDFFGGFFANGGMIPAGKFGVVGERGPELVSGPAQVTPMGGGTTVTYNINAVDAQSFKAMIAADPSFIYAVTQQGAKGVPARR